MLDNLLPPLLATACRYVYFFENDNPAIQVRYISGLIALIHEQNDGVTDNTSLHTAHFKNTISKRHLLVDYIHLYHVSKSCQPLHPSLSCLLAVGYIQSRQQAPETAAKFADIQMV